LVVTNRKKETEILAEGKGGRNPVLKAFLCLVKKEGGPSLLGSFITSTEGERGEAIRRKRPESQSQFVTFGERRRGKSQWEGHPRNPPILPFCR